MAFLLHQLLTDSAAKDPAQTAVVAGSAKLTYGELERLSNQIAHQLIAMGVRAGDRVGVFAPKMVETVAALFGIQKAGAAYVPVDPHAPPQRAAYILNNCAVRALVTTAEQASKLPQEFFSSSHLNGVIVLEGSGSLLSQLHGQRLEIRGLDEVRARQPEALPDVPITDNHLAYILYTSGSTGEPKGVMISHLNSLTFVNWAYDTFKVLPGDHVSSHAPFHFDLSVFDLFTTIKAGATIHIVPSEVTLFAPRLALWIAQSGITIWYSAPSAMIQMIERGQLEKHDYSKLRIVLFAGEVFPIKYLRRFIHAVPHPEYYNLYGPTETNVCTYYKVQASDIAPERTQPLSIGKACENAEVFALNEKLEPVGPGGEGELYVRCSTVMKGYWGRPQETEKAVLPNVTNPFYNDVMYKTGDIVRPQADGNFDYVGRKDKMIKSRGYRIELGEIEAALYAHPEVAEAAVIAIADEQIGARIRAWVVVKNGLNRGELEKFCLQRLPRYMMPETFEFRTELPRTSTGKVDKTSLEKESVTR